MSWFRQIHNKIKWAYQRVTRGWCDRDLWNLDCWFMDTVVPMLKAFKKNKSGHPGWMTAERWDYILSEMITHFENYDESNPINHNDKWEKYFEIMTKDYENEDDLSKFLAMVNTNECTEEQKKAKVAWLVKENTIKNFREREKRQAFELLCEYFEYLWD